MGLFTGVWRGLVDLVYPPQCWMCSQETFSTTGPVPLCELCDRNLWVLPQARCPGCGKINLKRNADRAVCRECKSGHRKFDKAVSIYLYTGTFRKLWHRVKFLNHPDWIQSLVDMALDEIGPEQEFNPYVFDAYTWAPTTAARKAARGFDPAELIARHLAKKYNRPLMELLHRVRECRPQFELSRLERVKNVEGAFSASLPRDMRTRAVLLVDDILTTGSTASACAQALKDRGIQKVVLITLSRGV